MTVNSLSKCVDLTYLKPAATETEIRHLMGESVEMETFAVCISPTMVPMVRSLDSSMRIATVCGFPSGKHLSSIKAAEAAYSVASGADEIDMVLDLGALKSGEIGAVTREIRQVRDAVPSPILLKVIIESATLSDEEIILAVDSIRRAGADFVKTSTGFDPAGGASEHAVALIASLVGGELGIKASGGIKSREDAERMLGAGATRLGLSDGRAVLG